MENRPLPLIILAGADRKPTTLPHGGADLHPLVGYKGMDLRIKGRPIIDLLLERLIQSGLFDPIFIAGPSRVYGSERIGAKVIDTDQNFGKNVENAITAVSSICGHVPIAMTTCDILPEVDELHRLMDDYYSNMPLDFWFPLIIAPEKPKGFGASYWKPKYKISPRAGEPAKTLLPGHLFAGDIEVMRLPLIYRILDITYQSRNQAILYRLGLIIRGIIFELIFHDLRKLLSFRLPTYTFTVLYNGIILGLRLRKGALTSAELADRLRKIFIRYRHRKRYPKRKGRLPLMHGLSLAKDIDTEEEAQEASKIFD